MNLSTFDAYKTLDSEDIIKLSDDEIRTLQSVLLGIYDDIAAVCEKYDIPVFLGGGSVLSAVRHQGFIPWDDDMDINFARKHYERFLEAFEKEFSDKYWIHIPGKTKGYPLLMAHIRLKGTELKSRDDAWNDENGVCVDIFPIENTYNNKIARWIHGMGCMYFGLMVSCRKFRQYKDWYTAIAKGSESLEKTTKTKIAIGTLISFRSLDRWVLKADRWNSRCKNHESEYVAVPTGRKNFFGEIYKRSGFCNLIDQPFAGRIAKIPKDFETYMKALYGNYMEIPPVEKRERHIFYPPMKLR